MLELLRNRFQGKTMKRDDIYYKAMLARDHRFDGKFFIGVKTTGIYCRPICPAKPKRENVIFFSNYLEAEKNGYRPCMRCRPECAPRSAAWIGTSAVVQRALKVLHNMDTLSFNESEFALKFGVTSRHLRRLFIEEIGKTPKQLLSENRLSLSRKLIVETKLPMTEIAYASGFQSVRRFNDAFKEKFKKSPSDIRRSNTPGNDFIKITLSYRPPFNFEALLFSYKIHKIGNLEWFTESSMLRIFEMGGHSGHVVISDDPENSQIILEINFPDTAYIHAIVMKVRSMFDLDSDPLIIANALEVDPKIKKILKKHPGIRLPSSWDPFEVAISTILGQLVSIDMARMLTADLIEIAGKDSGITHNGIKIKLFPTANQILAADLTKLKTTNMRKNALREFALAVVEKRISLEPTQEVEKFLKDALAIKGIGKWTADYMALKVLRSTDAFPSTDLILARVLEIHSEAVITQMSPWRGYAAVLFWREYSHVLTKQKKTKDTK